MLTQDDYLKRVQFVPQYDGGAGFNVSADQRFQNGTAVPFTSLYIAEAWQTMHVHCAIASQGGDLSAIGEAWILVGSFFCSHPKICVE